MKSCQGGQIFESCLRHESFKSGRGLVPTPNSHIAPLSEPMHDPNKHTIALRNLCSPSSWCGITITCHEELSGGWFFESRLRHESFKSGRGLVPTLNSHVAPLSEPIHDPNKHTIALRNLCSPSSWCGIPITCHEELSGGSIFRVSPQT